jgi:hypothetical protein
MNGPTRPFQDLLTFEIFLPQLSQIVVVKLPVAFDAESSPYLSRMTISMK